ncbi:MAG TPA: hypothetical protein PLD59_13120 [Tepidisphaeraceae bacterium]|nr:hypothetical protein [Tepidisphaeraceae bacterium]
MIIRIACSLLLVGAMTAAVAQPVASPRIALARKLPDLNLSNVALSDAIEFLRDSSSANIHVNWAALEGAGISKDTPVNLRLRGASLRKVLSLILTEAAGGADTLSFFAADGVLEITTREIADQEMVTVVYPVQDLLLEVPDFDNAPDFNLQAQQSAGRGGGGGGGLFGGGGGGEDDQPRTRDERAAELIDLIVETIQPDVWQDNGGSASIRFFQGNLIVRAPRSVHEALGRSVE